jgi:hypothetical protein
MSHALTTSSSGHCDQNNRDRYEFAELHPKHRPSIEKIETLPGNGMNNPANNAKEAI